MSKSTKKPVKKTIAATARAMIIAGRSDAQVYAALRRQHNLPETRRWYVRWFRAECGRKGLANVPTLGATS